MADNKGKKFEELVRRGFEKLSGTSIDRLFDLVGRYGGVSGTCDFIGYEYPFIFYIECKSHLGNTYPLDDLIKKKKKEKHPNRKTEYEILLEKDKIKGTNPCILLWFIDHKKVVYISIREFERIRSLGYKSINIKMVDNKDFNIITIPVEFKIVYPNLNLQILKNIAIQKLKDWEIENGKNR